MPRSYEALIRPILRYEVYVFRISSQEGIILYSSSKCGIGKSGFRALNL